MKKTTQQLVLLIFLLMAPVTAATAQSVTLVWDQSTEPEVVGYKVYYRTDHPAFPFNGTNLQEGASPIIVEGSNTTSLTLDLPEDGRLYYFAATAMTGIGQESGFSNIIASEWIPSLIAPMDDAVIGDTFATFVWEPHPAGDAVSFDLIYGTNPHLNDNAIAATVADNVTPFGAELKWIHMVFLAVLVPWVLMLNRAGAKRAWQLVRVGACLGLFVLQASCGGGGGGGGGEAQEAMDPLPSGTEASEPSVPPFTHVVENIGGTEYQVTDLLAGTQYYWKVVAVDNWGQSYESLTQTFTTLGN